MSSQLTAGMPATVWPGYTYADYAQAAPSPSAGVRGPLLLLVILCIALLSYWGDLELAKQVSAVSYAAVALLGAFALGHMVATGAPFLFPREFVLWTMFGVWCAILIPLSLVAELARRDAITLALMLGMAVIIMNTVNGRRAYVWFLAAMLVAFILASFGAITGLVRGAEVVEVRGGTARQYLGVFGNANTMGRLACLGAWAAVSMYFVTRRATVKAVLVVAMVCSVIVVGFSGSKQSILGLVLVGACAYWFVVRKTAITFAQKLAAAVVIVLSLAAMLAYLSTTVHWKRMQNLFVTIGLESPEGRASKSDTLRMQFFQDSLRTLAEKPFTGVGLRGMILKTTKVGRYMSPHNTIAQMAAETGVPGWLLFFTPWLLLVLRLRRAGRLPLPRVDLYLVHSIWMLHAAMFLWAFTTTLLEYKPFWACMAASLGYLLWIERTYGTQGYRSA